MKINTTRVLVTGGSSVIGFEITPAFLAHGAKVAFTGCRTSDISPLRNSFAEAVDESPESLPMPLRCKRESRPCKVMANRRPRPPDQWVYSPPCVGSK